MSPQNLLKRASALAAAMLFAGAAASADLSPNASPDDGNGSFGRFRERVTRIAEAHNVPAPTQDELIASAGRPAEPAAEEKKAVPDGAHQLSKAASPSIERIVDMGITKVRAVKGKDGAMLFIGDMGRFVFTGNVYDLWQKKQLSTIDDVADAVSRMNLSGLNIRPESLNLARFGTGEKHVTVFVDPLCSWCHKLMDEVVADPGLRNEYTFDFLVIPALGEPSRGLARRLFCSESDPVKRFAVLREGKKGIEKLAEAPSACRDEGNQRTQMTATFLGIHSVPFVISPDGRFSRGKPANLRGFLEGGSTDGGTPENRPAPRS